MEKLYGEQTELTIRNMSFSGVRLSEYPEYITNAARVKKACAAANLKAGGLAEDQAQAIENACDILISGGYTEQFPVDAYHGGGGIGINMNLNEVIASLAGDGIEAVNHVNMSQSTSDLCHTALRMTLWELGDGLLYQLWNMKESLDIKAAEFRDIQTIARTCWQDGMRVPLSKLFAGTSSAVTAGYKSLTKAVEEMRLVNIGWTVIGSGTGAGDEYRKYILQELTGATGRGFRWCDDPYGAAQYPADLARLSAEVRMAAEILGKLAEDIRLLSSGPETGLGEINVPPVQAGSSFFPGKVNPVIPETMMQCTMLIAGNDSIIQSALGKGEIHLNLWEEMMGFLLMDNIRRLTKMIRIFGTKCVDGITANKEKCGEYANSSIPLIVDFKEKYGYKALSDRIKKEGLNNVVRALRDIQK
jgi:Aspartate ammonia-lyase